MTYEGDSEVEQRLAEIRLQEKALNDAIADFRKRRAEGKISAAELARAEERYASEIASIKRRRAELRAKAN